MPQLSPVIVKNTPFLYRLAKTARANKKRLELIQQASAEQLLCIVEICLNILRSRVPLTRSQLGKLAEHAELIRKVSRARTERTARRLLLTGKGLPAALLVKALRRLV